MAHTWKFAIGLGFLSAALAGACTVKEGDDDDTGGAAGDAARGGTTGGSSAKGGNAGKGGSAGKGGTAGSGTGGTTGGSAGSSTGGTGAVGGTEGGGAGVGESGTGGTGGVEPDATCDPESGELDNTPWPDCEPEDSGNECQVCIKESCCEESRNCYGTEPNNVCGWGGPTEGEYEGYTEIGCFQKCLSDKVAANEMTCTNEDADTCAVECATTMCFEDAGEFPLIGNATNALAGCMQVNCAEECFGADTCGN